MIFLKNETFGLSRKTNELFWQQMNHQLLPWTISIFLHHNRNESKISAAYFQHFRQMNRMLQWSFPPACFKLFNRFLSEPPSDQPVIFPVNLVNRFKWLILWWFEYEFLNVSFDSYESCQRWVIFWDYSFSWKFIKIQGHSW